jgi:hypothetical protein
MKKPVNIEFEQEVIAGMLNNDKCYFDGMAILENSTLMMKLHVKYIKSLSVKITEKRQTH